VHVAIHAFKILNRRFPDARFHIIGDGPERESLIKLSESLQLSDVVRFFPPVPLAEVAAFLQRAQVGVVPKLADGFGNEAYSTKIMEFMATGLPVVASRTRIDEFYYGNGQVYFFRSGDANDLARALGEVLEDPLLRQQLIAQGLQYSQKNNWTAYSREYTNLVDSLLSNSNSSDSISPPPAALLGVRERSLPKVTAAHE
jgi:glycosyltransferase involved in cell wall biosynthesis